MRLHSLALLGFCLLSCPAAWAEEPPEDAPADSVDAPAANERPLLPERSISDAQTLEQRLDKREQQMLQAGAESFLALWLPANVGEPSGAVILLPGDVENADGAAAVGPLRRKLPDAGWHSLSITLPDPDGDPLPPRTTAVETPPATENEATNAEAENAAEDSPEPPAAPAATGVSSEQRRQAHVEIGRAHV